MPTAAMAVRGRRQAGKRLSIRTGRSELAENGLNRATFILFAAMIEGARAVNAESIVTVTDMRMERILRRAGWPLDPF
jgi:acyl homoserine lactone synthase